MPKATSIFSGYLSLSSHFLLIYQRSKQKKNNKTRIGSVVVSYWLYAIKIQAPMLLRGNPVKDVSSMHSTNIYHFSAAGIRAS